MEKGGISQDATIRFWLVESEEALQVADHLIEKQDFSYALFFGHLAIEKMLKAIYVARHGEHAPPLHNLVRLAKMANVELVEGDLKVLITISGFNIEARYPDIKRAFRKKCTEEYAVARMKEIREIFRWLQSQMP